MDPWLSDKCFSIPNQWEVYLGSELVEQHGFVNRDIIWQCINENIYFDVESVSNGTGKQPIIEQLSFGVFQWIDGNKITSGYIKGILDPQHVVTIFCRKKLWRLIPLI